MFRGEEIGRLARSEAIEAFVRPLDGTGVTVTDASVERVIDEVEGLLADRGRFVKRQSAGRATG